MATSNPVNNTIGWVPTREDIDQCMREVAKDLCDEIFPETVAEETHDLTCQICGADATNFTYDTTVITVLPLYKDGEKNYTGLSEIHGDEENGTYLCESCTSNSVAIGR